MPYRNPEDKQRWEREHRRQRNENRRKRRLDSQVEITIPSLLPDPTASRDANIAGYTIAIVIVVLAIGFLLVALTVWKARKRNPISDSTPDPQTLKGGSE